MTKANLDMTKKINVEPQFATMVQDLTNFAESLNASRTDLVSETVKFARKLKHQFEESIRLDAVQPRLTCVHRQYLLSHIRKVSNISEPLIKSRYNTIAEQADFLEKVAAYIPANLEAIYEIACASKKNEPVKEWIDSGKLTAESTIREIKKLRGKKTSERKKPHERYIYPVMLWFEDVESAKRTLSPIICSGEDFKIESEKAFANALKTEQDIHAAYLQRSAA